MMNRSRLLMLFSRLVYSTRLALVRRHTQTYYSRSHAYHPFRRAPYRSHNVRRPSHIEHVRNICLGRPNRHRHYLANKAAERSLSSKLEDARDAIMNKLTDILLTYKNTMTASGGGASARPALSENPRMLPLLRLDLLKHVCVFLVT